MRLKSYFVHTMEEALQTAKIELGDDAMLVDSKRLETPPGGRVRLEVIFAAPATPPPPPKVEPLPFPGVPAGSIAALRQFRGELTNLLDALNRSPNPSRLGLLTPATPQMESLRSRLLAAEVPPVTVDEIVQRCRPILEGLVLRNSVAPEQIDQSIAPLLAAEWPHTLGTSGDGPRIMAFVGPTGAGKTSAIAKLAFRFAISEGRPVSVLSVDNLRIGASDQLAHICSLLGVPFQSLDFSGALPAAVTANAHRGLILIDSPGYGVSTVSVLEDTASQFRRLDSVQCQLVLPANLRHSDLQRHYQQFLPFAPSRLLFTRLDETDYFGPAWALARDGRLSVDWVATGPGVPEDIEPADASRFAAALLGHAVYQNFSNMPQTSPYASAASAGGASRI